MNPLPFSRFREKPFGTGPYFTCQVRRNAQNGASKRAGNQKYVLQAAGLAGCSRVWFNSPPTMTHRFVPAEITHGVPE
jgi:hypothetical protein